MKNNGHTLLELFISFYASAVLASGAYTWARLEPDYGEIAAASGAVVAALAMLGVFRLIMQLLLVVLKRRGLIPEE